MITPEYCVTMARYNQWQNNSLIGHVEAMSEEDLRQDHGAFFGSILATLDHIVWADKLWLNRLDPSIPVRAEASEGIMSPAEWLAARPALDLQIIEWADRQTNEDMLGAVAWRSVILAKDFNNPRGLAITHMFNHQTHHRGQVHAMLTAMGRKTMDTDIVFMPET